MHAIVEQGSITAKVSQAIVDKLQAAAELSGATLNQFLVQAALEKADKIIDREKAIQLSQQDAIMLINLLENPPAPNQALLQGLAEYDREIKNGTVRSSAG